jgi:hypothetical protein
MPHKSGCTGARKLGALRLGVAWQVRLGQSWCVVAGQCGVGRGGVRLGKAGMAGAVRYVRSSFGEVGELRQGRWGTAC